MKILFYTGLNPKNLSGVSWKIWKIEQSGRAVTAWWGPIQVVRRKDSPTAKLQSKTWRFRTEDSARADADRRIAEMLRKVRLGIVTNGDHWMLVNAPKNETTGYASWYANLWLEEPVTLRAFRTVLGADRLFSMPDNETLEALLDKSASDQQEVTDQLGYQARKAVEVLIQALNRADQDHGRKLLADVDEKVLYESALTVMMRLVFLFCAEERELLLLGDELYDKNFAVSTLREQLRVTAGTDRKTPEWEVFIDPDSAEKGREFQLRTAVPPQRYAGYFEKIVLAERLREVRALVGFTRIESPSDYDNPAAFPANQRARLSRTQPTWVPASEIRGEGLFFHFKENVIQQWVTKNRALDGVFLEAHQRWRIVRKLEPPHEFYPGIRFVLLHSFAHALIRQLSVECGYTTASLRERIYSRSPGEGQPEMAGVLIYTAAPDSEGTLGGLVSLGRPETLERHLDQALDNMRLCASDPLCAEHHPYRDGTTLHAASCHACLFAPETSCERGNKYLDRAVLVPTVETGEQGDVSFFGLEQ